MIHKGKPMSNNALTGIALEMCHEQERLRLLELPPSLLDRIQSEHPPSLAFKSLELRQNHGAMGNAVLCTNECTFNVRQVHSSNSIYLVNAGGSELDCNSNPAGSETVKAVAQCTNTLELIPSSMDGRQLLLQMLPLYHGSSADTDPYFHPSIPEAEKKADKQAIFDNAPLSSKELEHAWLDTCAFELDGYAQLPTPAILARIWKSIVSAAMLNDISLTDHFYGQNVIKTVTEDGFPTGLFDAVMTRIVPNGKFELDKLTTIDREKCVNWVGGVLLETQSFSNSGIVESDFLHAWQNELPEMWRKYAAIDALKHMNSYPTKGIIAGGASENNSLASSVSTKASGKRPGKWHEKFGSARR